MPSQSGLTQTGNLGGHKNLIATDEIVNNPIETEQHNLTVEATVEATQVGSESVTLPKFDPYPDKTPTEILTREYLLTSGNIAVGTDMFLYPLQALLSNTTLQNYLKNFRFLRSGVRLRFLFVTNPMQYGLLGISRLPYIQPGETKWKHVEQQCQASMLVVDIGSQESVELILPYVNPQNMIEWREASEYPEWRVALHAFSIDTLSTATSATVYFQVFGSLHEPEASGLVQTSYEFQSGRLVRGMMDVGARLYNRVDGQQLYDTAVAIGGPTLTLAKGIATGANLAKGGQAIYDYATRSSNSGYEDDKETLAEDDYAEMEQQPMKLMLAADLSNTGGSVSKHYAVLGDNKKTKVAFLPYMHTTYSIKKLCMVPVYYDTIALDNAHIADPVVLNIEPFSVPSYFNYLSKMFRFWRGGFELVCYFVTATSASARVQVTVYPAQNSVTPDAKDVGDLPTTLVTVRGTETASFLIPFLSTAPWLDTNTSLPQCIAFTLSESIPQPFDKAVVVRIIVFLKCMDDVSFTSICSSRPSLTGEFQSKSLYPAPYMGTIHSLKQLLNRFSTRDPSLGSTTFTNGPLQIESYSDTVPQLAQLDNFDYVSNLFHFFTGSTCQKVFFDGSTVTGNAFVALQNPRSADYGSDTTCGNSVAMTNQAVWPCIEYIVPYNCSFPYLDIFGDTDNINTVYNYSASVTEYYVSAARDFQLLYVMPVPDFFYGEEFDVRVTHVQCKKEKEVGEFQSYTSIPRYDARQVFTGLILLDSGTSPIMQATISATFQNLNACTYAYEMEFVPTEITGTLSGGLYMALTSVDYGSTSPYFPESGPATLTGTIDVILSTGQVAKGSGFVSKLPSSGPPYYLTFGFTDPGADTYSAWIPYKLTLMPFNSGSCPVSPQITVDTMGVIYNDELDVNVTNLWLDTNIINQPVDVVVSNDDVSPALVQVTNTSSQPVPVTASGDFPVAATVMGVPGATTPVWVTSYPN